MRGPPQWANVWHPPVHASWASHPRPGISLSVLIDFIHRQVRGRSPGLREKKDTIIPGLREKKDAIIEEVSFGVDLQCTVHVRAA